MKPFIRMAIPVLCAGVAWGQTAADRQIETARQELESTKREYGGLRRALLREVYDLDDEARKLAKELRQLERDAELRTTKRRNLDRTVDARRAEFDYVVGILGQYSDSLSASLHPAENQLYSERMSDAKSDAGAAGDDYFKELEANLKIASIGLERLSAVTGGHAYEGKALRNGSESLEGSFRLMGPASYFSGKDGSFEGVSMFESGGTGLPTVVALEGIEDGMIANAVANGNGSLPFDSSMGKAIKVQAAQESIGETIEKGGIVGHAILLLGAVAIGLTLFKLIEITRFPVPSRRRINEILDDLLADRRDAAASKAAQVPGMSGDLVKTGVKHFFDKRRVLEEAMFEKLVTIKPRLDRFLPFLGLTAAAAPLMGLLGTVLGIIKTFKAMALDSGNKQAFTVGISEALITTAEGLVVAIPVLVLHGLMKSLSKGKFSEVEGAAIALMNGTTELDRKALSKPRADDEPDDGDNELLPNPA